jgi:hypothetical protein
MRWNGGTLLNVQTYLPSSGTHMPIHVAHDKAATIVSDSSTRREAITLLQNNGRVGHRLLILSCYGLCDSGSG